MICQSLRHHLYSSPQIRSHIFDLRHFLFDAAADATKKFAQAAKKNYIGRYIARFLLLQK